MGGKKGEREEERGRSQSSWSQFRRRERAQAPESCQPGSELQLHRALPV